MEQVRDTGKSDLSGLKALAYSPHTEDIEQAKAHIDEYGMCIVGNVLSAPEMATIDQRLKEQAAGEAAGNLGTIVR
ncbi:MAG TPA: hypothetical protein VMV27_17165 [Candidatus Binataceae bacterium]|nr:hypothetical protein [Candidatus Binataceae bacterium]